MAGERAAVLGKQSRAVVAAVACRSLDRARVFAAPFGARAYDDWRRVAEADVDGVIVATPNHVHKEQALAALEQGKHVLVEYPVATNMEDVKALFSAAERNDKVLAAGFNSLYRIRQIADRAGGLGRPLLGYHDGINQRPDDFGWYRDDSVSGGMIVLWGIEQIASLCHLIGRVRSVSAFGGDSFFEDGENEDAFTLALAFENGATACTQVTINAPLTVRTLRVVYEHGVVKRQQSNPPVIHHEGKDPVEFELEGPPVTAADTMNWIAACRGEAERFPSKEDVLHVHRVAFAARRAARTGHVITL